MILHNIQAEFMPLRSDSHEVQSCPANVWSHQPQ